MKKLRIFIVLFTVIACYFYIKFQEMAHGVPGIFWFWIGVTLSYLFSALALILIFIRILTRKITDRLILPQGGISMQQNIKIYLTENAMYLVSNGRVTKGPAKEYGTNEVIWKDGKWQDIIKHKRQRNCGQDVI